MDNGFVDLRQHSPAASGDSFWPSFTDIMTVVVMIFLLTSTILMLRNSQLVEHLRASIQAERQAAEDARDNSRANQTLETRLADEQRRLAQLQTRYQQATESNALKSQLLDQKNRHLARTRTQLHKVSDQLDKASRNVTRLRSQIQAVNAQSLKQYQQLASARATLADRETALAKQQDSVKRLRKQNQARTATLATLQDNYDQLQDKYAKLLEPARTPSGKHVVAVRYRKGKNGYRFGLKQSRAADYQALSRSELDRRLQQLKQKYADRLYVRIVIPDDSGLTYNEAWRFTQDTLDNYDYYYRRQ